jgi:hypothetical protein
MKLSKLIPVPVLILITHLTFAQISPPGLDGTKIVSWGVVGFSQALSKRLTLTVYGGAARMSDPKSWELAHKQGIAVYNHEFLYKLSPKWQVSAANSFRVQKLYSEESPYEAEDPSYRYELRYYGRLYYRQQFNKVSVNYAFRPEARTFYSPDWEASSRPLELRFRLKATASLPINQDKTNFIISGNEFLTAVDEYQSAIPADHHHTWSNYHFTEDRFIVYFRHLFKKPDVVLDLGLMEQFKSGGHMDPVSYVCFDVLFQNPFSKHFN